MENKGYTVHIDGPAGGVTVSGGPSNGDTNAANLECEGDMWVVSALRGQMLRNPQNLDENTIVAACLVQKKLAPPTYTAMDYEGDLVDMSFPFNDASPKFNACIADPLGLSGE